MALSDSGTSIMLSICAFRSQEWSIMWIIGFLSLVGTNAGAFTKGRRYSTFVSQWSDRADSTIIVCCVKYGEKHEERKPSPAIVSYLQVIAFLGMFMHHFGWEYVSVFVKGYKSVDWADGLDAEWISQQTNEIYGNAFSISLVSFLTSKKAISVRDGSSSTEHTRWWGSELEKWAIIDSRIKETESMHYDDHPYRQSK